MRETTIVVGSLDALREVLASGKLIDVTRDTDVVLLPTAAAFLGINEAAIELSALVTIQVLSLKEVA
jgi:hypothetical protein